LEIPQKAHGIPTFPQSRRRLLGYIFNVSIAELKVTFLNGLTRLFETGETGGVSCRAGKSCAKLQPV